MYKRQNTFHFEISPLNELALQNIRSILIALDTSQVEMSPLNDVAYQNMACISFTLDTSHLEMSPLKNDASRKMRSVSVTSDTSQDPIGPCGPLEQSVDSLRHSTIAALSSALDLTASPNVAGYFFVGINVL